MSKLELNQKLNDKSNTFIEKINSEMYFQADFTSSSFDFDWIEETLRGCPYIDNIVTNPKVVLNREQETVLVEKAKKISVASIKDLSRHTEYIQKIDLDTQEVEPSKLLIEKSEESFNTYENRFIYTLIYNLFLFVLKKEEEIENIEIKDEKVLEYAATTNNGFERINIELKMTANELQNDEESNSKSLDEKLDEIKEKIELIKRFITGWQYSEMYITLDKLNVSKVTSPIKRTNLILRNPNFQAATKLWDYLQTLQSSNEEQNKLAHDTKGNDVLKSMLSDAFLTDYYVLDSISHSKREQKKKLIDYTVIMMHQQIKRVIAMLLDNGIDISEDEILNIIAGELKEEMQRSELDGSEIKEKFRSAINEYIDKTQNFM